MLRTPGVAAIAKRNGYPTPVRDQELESVRLLVDGVNEIGILPTPEDYLEVGESVEVIDGPFKGVRGQLVEIRGQSRVTFRLAPIRQAFGVEVPRAAVRRLKQGE